MTAPLIEFAQFAHPQRWWMRRGQPPWLDDPRWYARAFRASLVLGVMGTATGWLTVGVIFGLKKLEDVVGDLPGDDLLYSELVILLAPGYCFGLMTLAPLSRWLGRGWIMTLLSIPASTLACYVGIFVSFAAGSGENPAWLKESSPFLAGVAGAAVVAAWMGNPCRKSAWLAGAAAALMAGTACKLHFEFISQTDWWRTSELSEVVIGGLYVGFQSATATGLGVRLWWGSMGESNQNRSQI
jgi:hypothetical protein